MAALQKIRSKGVLLIIIIGLGLFAFIAEEFFRSIETTANQSKQNVGKIYGESISSQEFQKMYEEYESALKFMRGTTSLTDAESTQARDYVWQMHVNYMLVAHECEALGLTVTDGELQQVLNEGNNPMLMQTPFRNEKTGRFDPAMLKNFLQEYEKMRTGGNSQMPQQYLEYYESMFNYWNFIEKTLRQNLLEQKYQVLLYKSILSNPVEAKMNFEGNQVRSNILLASFPYTSINDNQIKVSDSELQLKYAETKEEYRQYVESRDIKYVSVGVEASSKDKAELNSEMKEYAKKIASTDDVTSVVRSSNSLIPYSNIAITKNALPADIQLQLDSMAVGTVKGPYYNASDNTDNVIRLLAKVQEPDSVLFRQIQVTGTTAEEAHKRADSIYAALQGGAKFADLAKKYGQNGDSIWMTSKQYEGSTLDEDNAKFIGTINTMGAHQQKNVAFAQGNIIVEVLERKAITTKYNVAVIKRTVDFSKETYNKAYNKFSHFVATSPTLKDIEANARKNGYTLETRNDLYSSEHYVGNVTNTREAMKWIFDAKDGEISPLYECGNNDHLMLVVLMKTHKEGYRPLEEVKELVRAAVIRDKKAEMLASKLKNVKDLAQAEKIQGAVIDSLSGVTFNGDSFVKATGAVEPALNGSIWQKKANAFVGPVKGENGVYVYQILAQTKQNGKFDAKQEEQLAIQKHLRSLGNYSSDLYFDAKVVDKRYLFF
ncbi:MAG TPA: peptidylprolyl isomerase [Prevotellaceae bacterium]|nr:peptidylprolyl isomerase [Prevotellaceae bacterium]